MSRRSNANAGAPGYDELKAATVWIIGVLCGAVGSEELKRKGVYDTVARLAIRLGVDSNRFYAEGERL